MRLRSANAHIDKKIMGYGVIFGMIFLLASCDDTGSKADEDSQSNNATSVKRGDRVFAGMEDWENLYPGVVLEVDGDTYSVQFDDGDKGQVDRSQIIIDNLRAGDTLSCDWKGRGSYYPGRIRSRSGLQIEIDYDDGDFEKTNIKNCVADAATALAKSNHGPSQGSQSQQDKPASTPEVSKNDLTSEHEEIKKFGTCASIHGFSVLYLKDMLKRTNDSSLRLMINMDAHDHAIYQILLTEKIQAQPQEQQDSLLTVANQFMNENLVGKDINGPSLNKMKSDYCSANTITPEEKKRILTEYQSAYEQRVQEISS